MVAVYRHTFARLRGQVIGWGLGLALLAGAVASLYGVIADQRQTLEQLLASYPPEMMAFFGDAGAMFTPAGFLGVEYFSFAPIVLGIFAVVAGSGLLAGDEENGTLDLFLAHPVSRAKFYAGRLAAFASAVAGILAIIWLGLLVGERRGALGLSPWDLALPLLSLGAVVLLLGTLALALSLALPSRRMAAMTTGLVLVGSFFATGLARVNDSLKPIARLLPLDYYQGASAIGDLNLGWLLGLLAASAAFALLGAWLFQRRDIRVGGEGSWSFARLRRKPSEAAA